MRLEYLYDTPNLKTRTYIHTTIFGESVETVMVIKRLRAVSVRNIQDKSVYMGYRRVVSTNHSDSITTKDLVEYPMG